MAVLSYAVQVKIINWISIKELLRLFNKLLKSKTNPLIVQLSFILGPSRAITFIIMAAKNKNIFGSKLAIAHYNEGKIGI